jgi:3-(3-hydroxy-phenyl)propionate hydroxylase
MGAGVRDAVNLAWKLAGVLSTSLPVEVLDTYQQERRPHARHMIRVALGVGRAMTAGGDVGNLIRHLVVPRLRMLPAVGAKVLDSRTPSLRRSALVAASARPGNLAGRLCPNPVVAGTGRLDEHLGDGFAVVATTEPGAAEKALIGRRGAVLHLAAPGSELARWLRHGRAVAAIIRPDGTVMKAGRDVGALCAAPLLPRPCSPLPSTK